MDGEAGPSMRVLIVDDSADLRMLLSRVIERRSTGWQVVAQAVDGREAIDAASAHDVDLVLLDIAMPVMDGMEALPRIREAAPNAVVVMLSGFPFAVAGQGALDAGAHGYLEKTDLVKGLVPELEKIIGTVRAPHPPRS